MLLILRGMPELRATHWAYRYYFWLAIVTWDCGRCLLHCGKAGCLPFDPVSQSGVWVRAV